MKYNSYEDFEGVMLTCPKCGEETDSLKRYVLPEMILFLFVYYSYQHSTYTCCPHCMRKQILKKGFTYNIITANIMWLFVIFPWSVIQLLKSYTKGHSKALIKDILNQMNENNKAAE